MYHNSSQDTTAEASKPEESGEAEATEKTVSEIGEEAAPAVVAPATASPLKPIVLKLTSKPVAQEDQTMSADPLADPLSTTENPIESENKTEEPAKEDSVAADDIAKTDEAVKMTDTQLEAGVKTAGREVEATEEVKTADESKMETSEVSDTPALVPNPVAVAAAKDVESDAMDTEERLFYESVKEAESETVQDTSTKPADEADTKQGKEQPEEATENPTAEKDIGMDMDKLDYDDDGLEDMIEVNTDDISFDEPPKPTSEPRFKAKPITAPDKDTGLTPGSVITGNGITGTIGSASTTVSDSKEVTGTIMQFNEEHVLFEFSADGCRGLIGVVKTKHLKIPGKVFVSGSTKDMIKFIKVCHFVLENILICF